MVNRRLVDSRGLVFVLWLVFSAFHVKSSIWPESPEQLVVSLINAGWFSVSVCLCLVYSFYKSMESIKVALVIMHLRQLVPFFDIENRKAQVHPSQFYYYMIFNCILMSMNL